MAVAGGVSDFFSYWYYQYILCSALYFLEPWERKLFNISILTVIAMSLYTAYVFLPGHFVTASKILLDYVNNHTRAVITNT